MTQSKSNLDLLTEIIIDQDDYIRVKTQLEGLKRDMYKSVSAEKLKGSIDTDLSLILSASLGKSPSNSDSNGLAESIDSLLKELDGLGYITTVFPFTPTKSFLETIKTRLEKVCHLSNPTYLKVIYDPTLVVGCVVECGGRYMDFSLKTKIEQYVEEHVNAKL